MVPANEPDVVNVMALATRATVKRPWALRIDPSHQLTTEVRLSKQRLERGEILLIRSSQRDQYALKVRTKPTTNKTPSKAMNTVPPVFAAPRW